MRPSATFDLRYRGLAFELPVAGELHADLGDLRDGFEQLHEERYGYRDADQELELVTLRVSAQIPGADVELGGDRPEGSEGSNTGDDLPTRTATLDGERVRLCVHRGAPAPETELAGPAVVELAESTLLIPPGWAGEVDATGTIHLRSERDGSR